MEASGGGRRRLAHQVAVVDTSNLRDLLRAKDDEESYRESLAGLTLGAVLGCEATRQLRVPPVSRTLLEIIRDEESGTKGLSSHNRRKWKSFRDRLRLRRAGAAWTSSSADGDNGDCILQISDPIPTSPLAGSTELAGNGRENRGDIVTEYEAVTAANGPVMIRLAAALEAERELQRRREIERERSNPAPVTEEVRQEQVVVEPSVQSLQTELPEEEEEEEAPARMSLMALLEETDRQSGLLGSTLMGDAVLEEEQEEAYANADEDGGDYACCVCMVRHKGAAFIPCGHTFCRLCSRELWVSRGNCPLCNGFIMEILDIF